MRRNPYAAAFETTPESTADDLGRRLAVGVRQPAVEREERRLDGERGREAEEDPVVRRSCPSSIRSNVPCCSPKTMIDASISSEPAIV